MRHQERAGVFFMPRPLKLPAENYYTWRKLVLARDKFICQVCGKANSKNVHHIKRYRDFPELRYKLDNGLTLCGDCHKETDNYGKKYGSRMGL